MRKKNKKINKVKISLIIFIGIIFFTVVVFGEYVLNEVREKYLVSKEFYFSSDILDMNTPKYEYNNWSGVGATKIPINLYSYNNALLRMDEDISYELTCETTSSKVTCAIDSPSGNATSNGTIFASTNRVKKDIYVCPKTGAANLLTKGETVKVKVVAKGIGKYQKSVAAEFLYTITDNFDYKITDSVGDDYAIVTVSNINTGNAKVTLTFDPQVVRLDLTDDVYINANSSDYTTQTIDGTKYVKSITFNMLKESSKNIKLYKIDTNQDYTYPNADTAPIVQCQIKN